MRAREFLFGKPGKTTSIVYGVVAAIWLLIGAHSYAMALGEAAHDAHCPDHGYLTMGE